MKAKICVMKNIAYYPKINLNIKQASGERITLPVLEPA